MNIIKVHDKEFKTFFSAEDIHIQVNRIATQINNDYNGKRQIGRAHV